MILQVSQSVLNFFCLRMYDAPNEHSDRQQYSGRGTPWVAPVYITSLLVFGSRQAVAMFFVVCLYGVVVLLGGGLDCMQSRCVFVASGQLARALTDSQFLGSIFFIDYNFCHMLPLYSF